MALLALRRGTVDLVRGELQRADGSTASLTTREAELLGFLAQRAGEDVSRDTLLVEVWGHHPDSLSRAVDHTMRRLRAKVELDPAHPHHLLTVHGVGYRFAPLPRAPAPQSLAGGDFLGRETELHALQGLIENSHLVEILGPGGVGKTRLVRQWLPPEGRFVDLSALHDPGQSGIAAAVARALGVGRRGLPAVLADTAPLLVLDNAEQVIEGVADWLAGLPAGPRVVLTSRIALPAGPDRSLQRATLRLAGLSPGSAVALYCHRAALAGQPTTPGPALEALVGELDHLPLAIELAAARAPVLGPADLHARIARQRFTALGERSAGPERHRALDRTIAWSWALLPPADRAALGRLTAFTGGIDPAAAEAVLGEGALATLDRLVGASFLVQWRADRAPRSELRSPTRASLGEARAHRPGAGRVQPHRELPALGRAREPGAARRLGLLESIRDYVLQHAAPEDIAAGRAAHRRWFAAAAERWLAEAGRSPAARHALRQEQDNLVAASRAAAAAGAPAPSLVAALAPGLQAQGPPALWAELVATVRHCGPAGARLEAGRRLALGDATGARTVLADTPATTPAHALLQARVHRACRDFAAAAAAIERGLAHAPDGPSRVRLVHQDALLAIDQGELSRARRQGRAALRAWQELGHDQDAARASCHLGHVALETGDPDEAAARYAHAEVTLEESGDRRGAAVAGAHRALAAAETGAQEDARAALDRAAAHARAVGDRRFAAFVRLGRAELALEDGALQAARQEATAARLALEDLGDSAFAAAADARLAVACARLGDRAATERAVGRAQAGLTVAGSAEACALLRGFAALARGERHAAAACLSPDPPLHHLPRRLHAWLTAACQQAS